MSSDDPYQILNVPRNATHSQIKSAYRKLALRYHPDKSKSESEKQINSEKFTKIGNAYEILGDEDRRRRYDEFGSTTVESGYEGAGGAAAGDFFGGGGFGFGGGRDPFDHPFFRGGFGGGASGRGGRSNGGFMDPFEIFRQAFGEDLYDGQHDRYSSNNSNGAANHDPFFNSGFGFPGHGMNHMNSMFESMQQQMAGANPNNGHSQSYSTSFSSSSTFGGGGNGQGGTRQSVTTKTQIINGKRQTVTERTTVHPDGRVETTTETTGDEDFPGSLEYGSGAGGAGGGRLMNGDGNDHGANLQRQRSRSSRY